MFEILYTTEGILEGGTDCICGNVKIGIPSVHPIIMNTGVVIPNPPETCIKFYVGIG